MIILSLIPLIGAIIISISYKIKIPLITLNFSLFTFFCGLLLITNDIGYDYDYGYNYDYTSKIFVLLTTFLIPLAILSTYYTVTKDIKTYYVSLLILESILLIVFHSESLIQFYCAFELSLVPLFILIAVFGGVNRLRAAFMLFLYTLAGSLFILLSFIFIIVLGGGTGNITFLSIIINDGCSYSSVALLFWGLFVSLAVKTPLVPFHVWLPRAHSEANLAGSILLAGIVLKLATFGFLRLLLPLIPAYASYYSSIIIIISLIGIVITSLTALRITDLKGLVAVSSVAHISVVIIGLFSNSFEGIIGAVILSIAHGFISPAAFFCVGGVLYNRFHTRQIFYFSGLSLIIPLFSTALFITCCGNIGVPLSFNFLGELLALLGVFTNFPFIAFLAGSSILLSACYTLWIYNRLTFGVSINSFTIDLTRIELHTILPLLTITLLLGIIPNPLTALLSYDLTTLLY